MRAAKYTNVNLKCVDDEKYEINSQHQSISTERIVCIHNETLQRFISHLFKFFFLLVCSIYIRICNFAIAALVRSIVQFLRTQIIIGVRTSMIPETLPPSLIQGLPPIHTQSSRAAPPSPSQRFGRERAFTSFVSRTRHFGQASFYIIQVFLHNILNGQTDVVIFRLDPSL